MNAELGRRVYREYCWFAAVLLAVLIGGAALETDGSPRHPAGITGAEPSDGGR